MASEEYSGRLSGEIHRVSEGDSDSGYKCDLTFNCRAQVTEISALKEHMDVNIYSSFSFMIAIGESA